MLLRAISKKLLLLLILTLLGNGIVPRAVRAAPTALVIQDPTLPHYDAALAQSVAETLRRAGYAPQRITLEAALQPGMLTPEHCALLAIPQGRALPTTLAAPLHHYLEQGGHLLGLGAPFWKQALIKDEAGQWTTAAQMHLTRALQAPPHLLFDFGRTSDASNWERSSDTLSHKTQTIVETATAQDRTAPVLHTMISDLVSWDTLHFPRLSAPFPAGDTMTVFSAKGGPRTTALSVEWDEQDGTRWIAVVPLSTEWQWYAVPPSAFHPWQVIGARAQAGFHPANAVQMSVGLALSHTGFIPGKNEYWVSSLGTGPSALVGGNIQEQADLPPLEMLAPDYKFFTIHGPAQVGVTASQALVTSKPLPRPTAALVSAQPRPSGAGFDKQRGWRQVSLLTATDPYTGQWRGTPGNLLLWCPGTPFGGGAWAAFSIDDPAFYQTPAMRTVLEQTARRMRDGLFLIEGGAAFYTLFPNQSVRIGAQVANLAPQGVDDRRTGMVRIRVMGPQGKNVWQKTWPLQLTRGQNFAQEAVWTPPAMWPAGGYTVTTELVEGKQVIDRLRHNLNVWLPPAYPDFIRATPQGHFVLKGQLWRALGVNYIPSSGIGSEDFGVLEQWLSRQAYDPEIIERDLSHIQDLGMNAVSAFTYTNTVSAQNLLDFLRRCREHHLHVNLSLRPELDRYRAIPQDEALRTVAENARAIIGGYRLAQNDTVFAYDIDWEPSFGNQEGRRWLDADWRAWVQTRYGSVEAAESAWKTAAPRESSGALTNPTDVQVSSPEGPGSAMVIDYRHFLDQWLAKTYGTATANVRALDPHHLVSFRMTETGNPTDAGAGTLAYQFSGLAHAVDFLSPEGYGRIGDWERVKPGGFEIAYGRATAPGLPILWAEVGVSTVDQLNQNDDAGRLAFQGQFYGDFLRMSRLGGADGVMFWWYPGGYRVDEGSDYGLINPDGTDRPSTQAIRRQGSAFLKAPLPPTPDVWLTFDPDAHPDGTYGVYQALGKPFFDAIDAGHHPGLRSVPSGSSPIP